MPFATMPFGLEQLFRCQQALLKLEMDQSNSCTVSTYWQESRLFAKGYTLFLEGLRKVQRSFGIARYCLAGEQLTK